MKKIFNIAKEDKKQFVRLGKVTDKYAEFYFYNKKTQKQEGTVFFIYFHDFCDDYKTGIITDNELVEKSRVAARDLIKKEQGIF